MSRRKTALRARLRWVLLWVSVICLAVWGLDLATDYSMSLAVVSGGVTPGFAATDADAFRAVSQPTETTPGVPQLREEGRVLVVEEGTRCRIIKEHPEMPCQGHHLAFRVKLLDGPRRGQVVWMCSDGVAKQYLPP
jgi:hypothetical protein